MLYFTSHDCSITTNLYFLIELSPSGSFLCYFTSSGGKQEVDCCGTWCREMWRNLGASLPLLWADWGELIEFCALVSSGSSWDWRCDGSVRSSPVLKFSLSILQGTMAKERVSKNLKVGCLRGIYKTSPRSSLAWAEPHPWSRPRRTAAWSISTTAANNASSPGDVVISAHPLKMLCAKDIQHLKNSMNFTVSKNIIAALLLNKTSLPMMSQMHFASMAPHTWETELFFKWTYL